MTPSKIGRYTISGELGRGGMAIVYDGYDPVADRSVAIKVLRSDHAQNPDAVESFLLEAKKVIQLEDHDHILTVYEVDQDGDQPFIAMKRVTGQTLESALRSRGVLPLDMLRAVAAGVGGALEYAHRRGIVHCDVKPSNIMLDRVGRPYLMDFGISQAITESLGAKVEQLSGFTPSYASPEQVVGETPIMRSDIYALGLVLYEMCTGINPFADRGDRIETIAAIVQEDPKEPRALNTNVSDGLNAAIMKALSKEPVDRFDTVAEFVDAVLAATDTRVGATLPQRTPPTDLPPATTNRDTAPSRPEASGSWRVAVAIAAALALFAAVYWITRPDRGGDGAGDEQGNANARPDVHQGNGKKDPAGPEQNTDEPGPAPERRGIAIVCKEDRAGRKRDLRDGGATAEELRRLLGNGKYDLVADDASAKHVLVARVECDMGGRSPAENGGHYWTIDVELELRDSDGTAIVRDGKVATVQLVTPQGADPDLYEMDPRRIREVVRTVAERLLADPRTRAALAN